MTTTCNTSHYTTLLNRVTHKISGINILLSMNILFCHLFDHLWCICFFQDLLYLVGSHPKNRSTLTSIREWPEWILEVLISNHEAILLSWQLKEFFNNHLWSGSIFVLYFGFLFLFIDYNIQNQHAGGWWQRFKW